MKWYSIYILELKKKINKILMVKNGFSLFHIHLKYSESLTYGR